jgi:hypothetical protein
VSAPAARRATASTARVSARAVPARGLPLVAQPPPARRPILRVVPVRVRRRRAGVIAVLVFGSVFGIMVGLTAFQARIAKDQMQLDQLTSATRAAQQRYERLRVIAAQYQSPSFILTEATKLGLKPPDVTSVQYVSPTVADVTEAVIAAGGGDVSPVAAVGVTRPDWSNLKPVVASP